MKNLQTGTTCLSKTTGSKQHKCERSLQRLATFVILFLCSMTVSWAQETTDKTSDLVIKSGVQEYISRDNSITATCTGKPSSSRLRFTKGGNDTFTIIAKDATISKVSLLVNTTTKKPKTGKDVNKGETKVPDYDMPVEWSNGYKQVVFKCSTTTDLYVFGVTITYKYDENLKLDNVYAPKITPDGTAVVGNSLNVQISDEQWEEAKAKNFDLKIHYVIEEGSNYGTGIVNNSTWTEVDKSTELPLTINLTKTSTISAYAEYTNSNNEAIKSDVVSNTYFLLDANTTYLNTENTQDVGFTVKKNGMTMTYGGLKVGSENFTTLSKNKNTDTNILGSNHTVSGNALYGTKDAESERGDGNIGGTNTSHEYLHCNASNVLHERTFALPAVGSFFKFEPDANGKLTVFVEQQGAIHNVSGNLISDVVRKRPVYFLDETGTSIPANYAYTSSKVNKANWTEIQNTDNKDGDTFYTKEYMDKLQKYYQNIIDGNNQDFKNFNSAVAEADKHKALTLGTSIQPIIVLHDECNAEILKGDGMSVNGDTNYDGTGYMLISEGYVTYEFPVKAGKTYYLFASRTKLALSGFCFDIDPNYKTENLQNVTLEGNANNTDAINKLEVGKQYNVTLNNRTFRSGRWYSVVLPFSVSQKQMKTVFGDGVKVLHYSDVEGTDLNLFEHFYQMIVSGTPVLVKPSQDVTNPVFNNVTLTSQKVVDIENTGFKCTGSWDNVDFPAYSYFIDAKTNSFYLYDPTKVEKNTVKPHAGAFRSWIISTSTNPSEAKQLTMHINGIEEQGETTAIWNAISGNDDAATATKGIYNLSGQKMNATDTRSLPKGIYIVNGKKFIVK